MSKAFPITQRPAIFNCSCCPPNINRILPSLGNYVYAKDGDTLYVNQFISSTLTEGGIGCTQKTNYPNSGTVSLIAKNIAKLAIRIPSWCERFTLNKSYTVERGYAVVDNDGGEIIAELDITPKLVYTDSRVIRNTGRVCITKGPVVYCAESVDNGTTLHSYSIPVSPEISEIYDESFGLYTLRVSCLRDIEYDNDLYSSQAPHKESAILKLIPYNCFANRGESDMVIWLRRECL